MAPVYLSKIELLICILLFYKVLRDKIRWLKLLQVIFKSGKYQNLLKGIGSLEDLPTNLVWNMFGCDTLVHPVDVYVEVPLPVN